jgi:hypothetical protein
MIRDLGVPRDLLLLRSLQFLNRLIGSSKKKFVAKICHIRENFELVIDSGQRSSG